MTVSTEIQKMKIAIKDAYIALEAKGATLPEIESLSNLATTVATIPSGGSGGDEIEVINNTGRAINVGDKVWLNKDASDGFVATSEYNDDSITGFAQTSAESGEFFTVLVILPRLINVYVSVDVDNAYIGVE